MTAHDIRSRTAGVLLAGGQSRRMGGGDKGLLPLAGKPMLRHVVDRLTPQVQTVIINANGDPARFSELGLPVVADPIGGFVGPLAGVLAGMRWAERNLDGAGWVVTAPADAPLLPRDLVARFAEALEGRTATIALAQSGGELHPVVGLWPLSLAQDLEEQIRAGMRKVVEWTYRHETVAVRFEAIPMCGLGIDPFYNANTPQELDDLRAMLSKKRR